MPMAQRGRALEPAEDTLLKSLNLNQTVHLLSRDPRGSTSRSMYFEHPWCPHAPDPSAAACISSVAWGRGVLWLLWDKTGPQDRTNDDCGDGDTSYSLRPY